MGPLTCPKCRGKYAAHFARCPYCNAPNAEMGAAPASAVGVPNAAQPAAVPAPAIASTPASTPQKPACPCCGGVPGSGKIRMETREYKGPTPGLRPGRSYLVRWVDVPMVCAGCMRGLEIRRYMADVLSIVPFIVACIGLAVFDSKAFLWILGIYGLYLFKWTWGLGYVWADAVLYGAGLERTLSSFTPAGDRGTIRFPAGLWHCLVRLGWVPALLIVLGIVVGIFGGHSGGDNNQTGTATAADTATAPQEPSEPESADPKERAKARSAREIVAAKKFLQNARDIVVPVDPQTLLMKKENVNRTDMSFYSVYVNPEQLPAETSYQLATGPQMLAMFLKTKGHDVDFLMIKGPNLPLSRWQAAKIAAEWPAADPPNTAVLQR